MLNSAEHEICPANESQITIANSFLLNIAEHELNIAEKISLLINTKMPT